MSSFCNSFWRMVSSSSRTRSRCSSSTVIRLPALINFSWISRESLFFSFLFSLSSPIFLWFSSIRPSHVSTSASNCFSWPFSIALADSWRSVSCKFSSSFFMSSYFLIPKTSEYARLKFLRCSAVFTSAKLTIFSASKKKNFAISIGMINSRIKISCPTSLANSLG